MKWDQSCFKGACRHGPQNNSTVKKVALAFAKRLMQVNFQLKGWLKLAWLPLLFLSRTINLSILSFPEELTVPELKYHFMGDPGCDLFIN